MVEAQDSKPQLVGPFLAAAYVMSINISLANASQMIDPSEGIWQITPHTELRYYNYLAKSKAT